MSEDGTTNPAESNQLVAAEYVLGVLSAAERRQATQRMAHDQPFAEEVAFWEERLGTMAEDIAPVEPPATAWKRVARRVGVRDPAERESLWQSLSFWRSFAIGSAVLTAASIGALTFVELSVQRVPLLATLGASNGQPDFFASVDASGNAMLVVPAVAFAADQRAMELWLIPPGDKPHSLGLIDPARPVRMKVPRDLARRVTMDAALAVSMEPPGGSPTGAPTGPVIASGKLTSL